MVVRGGSLYVIDLATGLMRKDVPVVVVSPGGPMVRRLEAAGIERPILFGHSDGATIALMYAAAFPDRAAACIAPRPGWQAAGRCAGSPVPPLTSLMAWARTCNTSVSAVA